MMQHKITIVILLCLLLAVPGRSQRWFKQDSVKVVLNKAYFSPGSPALVTFRTLGWNDSTSLANSLRFSNSVSETSMRYRISKLRTDTWDSLDIGIPSIPG